MGIIDNLKSAKKKYNDYSVRVEKRRATKRLQNRLNEDALIQDAKAARMELKRLKKVNKAKKDIAKLKEYKNKTRPDKLGGFFGTMDSIGSSIAIDPVTGKKLGKKKRRM